MSRRVRCPVRTLPSSLLSRSAPRHRARDRVRRAKAGGRGDCPGVAQWGRIPRWVPDSLLGMAGCTPVTRPGGALSPAFRRLRPPRSHTLHACGLMSPCPEPRLRPAAGREGAGSPRASEGSCGRPSQAPAETPAATPTCLTAPRDAGSRGPWTCAVPGRASLVPARAGGARRGKSPAPCSGCQAQRPTGKWHDGPPAPLAPVSNPCPSWLRPHALRRHTPKPGVPAWRTASAHSSTGRGALSQAPPGVAGRVAAPEGSLVGGAVSTAPSAGQPCPESQQC